MFGKLGISGNSSTKPCEMNRSEILAYLNSGAYISSTMAHKLQERLDELDGFSNENKFSILRSSDATTRSITEFLSVLKKPSNARSNKKFDTVSFPQLSEVKITTPQQHLCDYTAISENLAHDDGTISTNTNNATISIYTNDKLHVSWASILEAYNLCSPYRIRLDYLTVSRKIFVLNSIAAQRPDVGAEYKKIFKYNELVERRSVLKNCTDLCVEAAFVINILGSHGIGSVIDLFSSGTKPDAETFDTMHAKVRNIFSVFGTESLPVLSSLDQVYQLNVNTVINAFDRASTMLDSLTDNSTCIQIHDINSECTELVTELENMIDKVVSNVDRHIECAYCCCITSTIEEKIAIDGIESWTYVSCDSEIDTSMINTAISSATIANISPDDFVQMFEVKKASPSAYPPNQIFEPYQQTGAGAFRASITSIDHQHPDITLYFCVDEEPRYRNTRLVIDGIPDTSVCYSDTIYNPMISNAIDLTRTADMVDLLDPMSRLTFGLLKSDDRACKTAIRFVFDKLLESDIDNKCITPTMFNSFAKLVYSSMIAEHKPLYHQNLLVTNYNAMSTVSELDSDVLAMILNLYNVIEKYNQGEYDIYNPNILEYVTVRRFVGWVLAGCH